MGAGDELFGVGVWCYGSLVVAASDTGQVTADELLELRKVGFDIFDLGRIQ